jgi:hypothetical protein
MSRITDDDSANRLVGASSSCRSQRLVALMQTMPLRRMRPPGNLYGSFRNRPTAPAELSTRSPDFAPGIMAEDRAPVSSSACAIPAPVSLLLRSSGAPTRRPHRRVPMFQTTPDLRVPAFVLIP